MKTKYIFFFILSLYCSFLNAQIINFPDANFKARLLIASPSVNVAATGWNGTTSSNLFKIDANNDGEIDQSEALAVTMLNVAGRSVSDLSGLEFFTNLRILYINNPLGVII